MKIANVDILPGEEKQINASIAKLPTRTTVEIPIIVSRSKITGPSLLLMGGMHGDETNGIEIVRRIIAKGYNRPLKGSTICIPILNIYGFIQSSRQVPDGKDINRAFPGSRTGSLASQIAYHLMNEILTNIDCGLDFHTGGGRINNFPQIRTQMDQPKNLALAKAFSPRFILDANLREKSFRKAAQKVGKPILVFEGGESQRLHRNTIAAGVNGALRVMEFLDMREDSPKPEYEPLALQSSKWIRAKGAGLFHSLISIGGAVSAGSTIGLITSPFGDSEFSIKSPFDGHIIAVNNNPVVNRGDALFHLGII